MLAVGPRDLNSAPYSPVHCSSHSMTSFQSSELTELPVVENSQLFAQRVHSARHAPYESCALMGGQRGKPKRRHLHASHNASLRPLGLALGQWAGERSQSEPRANTKGALAVVQKKDWDGKPTAFGNAPVRGTPYCPCHVPRGGCTAVANRWVAQFTFLAVANHTMPSHALRAIFHDCRWSQCRENWF